MDEETVMREVEAHGRCLVVTEEQITTMLVDVPRAYFE